MNLLWNFVDFVKQFLVSLTEFIQDKKEKRFFYSFIPISAFYWFAWGLYKGSVGDDDSFFFLPSYHNLIRFIDKALDSYGITI